MGIVASSKNLNEIFRRILHATHRSHDSDRDFENRRIDKESQLNDNAQYPIESYSSPGLTAPEGRDVYRCTFPLDPSPGWGEM
jgi:hypothetical protein